MYSDIDRTFYTMSLIDREALRDLLTQGPARTLVATKQLTLAFGGLYIASTSISAKALLVWETEKAYPRYYVPLESLHGQIREQLASTKATNGRMDSEQANGNQAVRLEALEWVEGKGMYAEAVIERLSIGSKSTTWVRFVEGPQKGFVRFERKEIGMSNNSD